MGAVETGEKWFLEGSNFERNVLKRCVDGVCKLGLDGVGISW